MKYFFAAVPSGEFIQNSVFKILLPDVCKLKAAFKNRLHKTHHNLSERQIVTNAKGANLQHIICCRFAPLMRFRKTLSEFSYDVSVQFIASAAFQAVLRPAFFRRCFGNSTKSARCKKKYFICTESTLSFKAINE